MAKAKKTGTNQSFSYINGTNRDQFAQITSFGEPALGRTSADNPKFLWPSDQYTDIAGRTHKVQRGYMRSLITDSELSIARNIPNRRLFFQFNPEALRRSVQQTPGAMNPLLQDPAQLTQPVPGTSSFGFRLFFNREHEVNAGGTSRVANQGVLADLWVLDIITGQGLSEDFKTYLTAQMLKQQEQAIALDEQQAEAEGKESKKSYKPNDALTQEEIETLFDTNIGNSAFLNPLPFRAVFSSLFMVEGIANSIDVTFQKFSRTMVPTQCVVDINMYALYIGFAKKRTFLYDNLTQAKIDYEKQSSSDQVTKGLLDYGIKNYILQGFYDRYGDGGKPTLFIDLDRTDQLKEQIKKKQVKDVKVKVSCLFGAGPSDVILPESSLDKEVDFTYDGQAEIPLGKVTDTARLVSDVMGDLIKDLPSTDRYVTVRFSITLTGIGNKENTVASTPVVSPFYKFDRQAPINTRVFESQRWPNPNQYGRRRG